MSLFSVLWFLCNPFQVFQILRNINLGISLEIYINPNYALGKNKTSKSLTRNMLTSLSPVKPRLRLGFIYFMRPCLIPKTQAEPAGIYTAQAKPKPNGVLVKPSLYTYFFLIKTNGIHQILQKYTAQLSIFVCNL